MLGLNIVESAGDDAALIDQQVATPVPAAGRADGRQRGGRAVGWQVCHDLEGVERIYAMRKKAVGLLGNAKGAAKPIPFAEDTRVPPEHLADYIVEFRALLDSHGLSYGMFGHVDAGVLHVRPALDMCDPQQEVLMEADLRRGGSADGEAWRPAVGRTWQRVPRGVQPGLLWRDAVCRAAQDQSGLRS